MPALPLQSQFGQTSQFTAVDNGRKSRAQWECCLVHVVYSFSQSTGQKPLEEEERSLQADNLVKGDRGLETECTAKGQQIENGSVNEKTLNGDTLYGDRVNIRI
ncbi:hypothetical protein B0H14DRAFT_2565809 [Mycena olivaceomarginata]|nr:hypothetical protein B0H14DRAFT_2565809 [Mycena olivaceomarginata]